MQKKVYDLRGKQTNIFRLAFFDPESFIHMVGYRLLIVFSMIYGVIMLSPFFVQGVSSTLLEYAMIIEWILFTPTAYATIKGFTLIMSGGLAFGHLSESYTSVMENKYSRSAGIFSVVPYVAMLLWISGFVIMVMFWRI